MTISEPEYKIESGLSSESYTIRQAFKTNNSVKIKRWLIMNQCQLEKQIIKVDQMV